MNRHASCTICGLSERDFVFIAVAGLLGEIVLEFVAWVIFPPLLGVPMRPHILVTDLGRSLLGVEMPVQLAVAIHLALGFFIFPIVYVIARRALGMRSWLLASVLWGVLLWAIAQTTLAPLAGRPFMLGIIPYTWGSLFAHVVYTVAVGWVFETLSRRFADG